MLAVVSLPLCVLDKATDGQSLVLQDVPCIANSHYHSAYYCVIILYIRVYIPDLCNTFQAYAMCAEYIIVNTLVAR